MSESNPEITKNDQKKSEKIIETKPLSKENQKKGAHHYAWLLVMNRNLQQLTREENKKAVFQIIKFQKNRPHNPARQVAYDYWARRILLGKTR